MKTVEELYIELYAGPHDGLLVDCPQIPPCCFVLPGAPTDGNDCDSVIYHFVESRPVNARQKLLRYGFLGYQSSVENQIERASEKHESTAEGERL